MSTKATIGPADGIVDVIRWAAKAEPAIRAVVERARAECSECPFSDHDLDGRVIAAERCEICRLKLVAELLPLVEDEA